MAQSAARIASIIVICAATTPAVAGPRGGGQFGAGGVHFGGGGGGFAAPRLAAPHIAAPHFSAPSFAPRFSTPHFSAPPISPHIAAPPVLVPHAGRSTPIPFTTRPQQFARPPAHLPQSRITTGQTSSRPMLGAVRQIPRPTNQAANAFAFSGVHRSGSAQILRNPFFANRPVLAHATFRGRFTQFSSRDPPVSCRSL